MVYRSIKNDQLEHSFSGCSKLSDFVFQVPIVSLAPTISVTPSQNDKMINHLTDMMESLVCSVCTSQGKAGIPLIIFQPRAQPVNKSSESYICTDYQGTNANKNLLERANKCIYCWETDHYLKRHCQVFHDDLNSNRIHLRDKVKVCLSPYLPGVKSVYMRQEKSRRKFVTDAEKSRYMSLPPVNVQALRIEELDPDLYSSNKKNGICFFKHTY